MALRDDDKMEKTTSHCWVADVLAGWNNETQVGVEALRGSIPGCCYGQKFDIPPRVGERRLN